MSPKFNKIVTVCSVAALAVTAAVPAFAVGIVDYTGIGTTITAEITPAITAVLPIAGTLLAIAVGWKLVRRFLK